MSNWKSVPVLQVEEHLHQFQVETGYGGVTILKKNLPPGSVPKVGDVLLLLVDHPDKPLYPGDVVHAVRIKHRED